MELMERVKAECEGHSHDCAGCKLMNGVPFCKVVHTAPYKWDIEAIRKALGETSDKASDKEEIVVPYKWSEYALGYYPCNVGYTAIKEIMIKQDEIIDCLEQIKEVLKR